MSRKNIKKAFKTLVGLNRDDSTQVEAAIWLFILSIPLGLSFFGVASLKFIAVGLFMLVCSTNIDQTLKVLRSK